MNDSNPAKKSLVLTKGIKIAAIYLIVAGGIGMLFPLLSPESLSPEIQAKSLAYKVGFYLGNNVTNILFFISGIGILSKKPWARIVALVMLVIGVFHSANNFAWGVSSGLGQTAPSLVVRVVSFSVVALWNGLWFFLIYRVKPKACSVVTAGKSLNKDACGAG